MSIDESAKDCNGHSSVAPRIMTLFCYPFQSAPSSPPPPSPYNPSPITRHHYAITERTFKALIELLVARSNSEIHAREHARLSRYKCHVQRAHFFGLIRLLPFQKRSSARPFLNALLPLAALTYSLNYLPVALFSSFGALTQRNRGYVLYEPGIGRGYIKHKMP